MKGSPLKWRNAGDSKWEAVMMLPPVNEEPTTWNVKETIVGVVVLTGRYGADDYPWDWYGEERFGRIGAGVTDTLRSGKAIIESQIAQRMTGR